jgi:membrane protease YdiL (CAAX protease family)
MEYRSVKGFTGWGQLGILFAFIGGGFIIAAIIQLVIGFSLIDKGLPALQQGDAMLKALFKPENLGWLQISQVLTTFFVMFLPAVAYSLICNGKYPLWLGFSKRINVWQLILGFCIIYCANVVAQPLQEFSKLVIGQFPRFDRWAKGMEDAYNQQVLAMSNLKSWSSLVIAIIVIAFFPALFEEMLFRGAIQNLLIRWWKKPLLAIIVTSVLFSFIHGEAYPFLSRAVLGFALGMLYWQSQNIWVNVGAHFLNNAFYLVQLFIVARSSGKTDISKIDDHFPLWIGILSAVIFYFLFVVFKKISARNRNGIEMDEQKLWIRSTPQYNLAENINPSN